MWPRGPKTSFVARYLWKDSSFLTWGGGGAVGPDLQYSYFPSVSIYLIGNWTVPKPPGSTAFVATGMNAVEIYQFPPLNLSPLAINFYSVTKNRLMARMSLPPTHRVQWEDEPGGEGGGEITSKKKKERETARAKARIVPSISAACVAVCQGSGRRDAGIHHSEKRSDARSPLAASVKNPTASDFARAPRTTAASVEFMRTLGCERCVRVLVILRKHDENLFHSVISLKYWKANRIYLFPPHSEYHHLNFMWPLTRWRDISI